MINLLYKPPGMAASVVAGAIFKQWKLTARQDEAPKERTQT
jgi:hypothetical protein